MKDYTDIIIAPVITEKSAAAAEKNVYTFKVASDANKTEIKKAIEADNEADMTKGIETLTNALSDLSKDVYSKVGAQQAQQQPGAENAQTGAGSEKKEEPKGDDDVIDAEYKVKE